MLHHLACLSVRWTYQFCMAPYIPSNKLYRHASCYANLDLHNFPKNYNRKVCKLNFSLQKWKWSDAVEYCWATALTQSVLLQLLLWGGLFYCAFVTAKYIHICLYTECTVFDVIYVYTNTHIIDHTISTSLHRILLAVDLQEPNYCICRGVQYLVLINVKLL